MQNHAQINAKTMSEQILEIEAKMSQNGAKKGAKIHEQSIKNEVRKIIEKRRAPNGAKWKTRHHRIPSGMPK